jgi:hypothetical protein
LERAGLTAVIVITHFHRQRVIPLIERALPIYEMTENADVTSLILPVCKNVEFRKLALNLSAYEINKDAFLFPFPKVLDFNLVQSIILGLIKF